MEAAAAAASARSTSTTGNGVTAASGEALEEEEEEEEQSVMKVFVALPEKYKSGRSTLAWALRHLAAGPAAVVVVVAHVHSPAQMIPILGSKFQASKLRPEEVAAYRHYERGKVNKHLEEYIRQCSKMKIKGEKLVIEHEDVAEGIVELVSKHNVGKLVMGAAADKYFSRSRKMEAPRSKKALAVMQNADLSCKIWFVCKENLIYTRVVGDTRKIPTPTASASARYSVQPSRYAKMAVAGCMKMQRSMSEKALPLRPSSSSSSRPAAARRALSVLCLEDLSVGSWDSVPRESLPRSCRGEASSSDDDDDDDSSSFEVPLDEAFAAILPISTAPGHDQQVAKFFEDLCSDEAARKTKVGVEEEAALAKAKEEARVLKGEMEALKRDRDAAVGELSEQKAELEQRVAELEDAAASEAIVEEEVDVDGLAWRAAEFSLVELRLATGNFGDAAKIGEGVYRGVLRGTTAAIKLLPCGSSQGRPQFQREVCALSRVRHPNVVTPIGYCPKPPALVYEFLPNGTLEDRLATSPPLTWQARTRIIGEVCAALVRLHSAQPRPVIHGDLNPSNVLLTADLDTTCQLADAGGLVSSRLLLTATPSTAAEYADPELQGGEPTASSDVYAFGVLVLRLVTGAPPLGVAGKVEEALERGEMEEAVDRTAGEWPFAQAEKLMLLGLQCAEASARRRPDRMSQVWRVVEPLVKAAAAAMPVPAPAAESPAGCLFGETHTPLYFTCPISQEVMRNPHVAADGFTYEAEAIKGWLDSGHDTSPMTKLALPHRHVTPNYALRSAIEDYMQQQQQQQQHTPASQSVRSN